MLYANRLAARRHTLGLLDAPAPPGAPKPQSDSAAVEPASEPDRPGSAAEMAGASPAPEVELQQAAAEERSADELILQGRLAQLVHDEAVQKLPDDAALRRGMLRVVAAVPCLGSAALAAAVAERTALDFRNVRDLKLHVSRYVHLVASCARFGLSTWLLMRFGVSGTRVCICVCVGMSVVCARAPDCIGRR